MGVRSIFAEAVSGEVETRVRACLALASKFLKLKGRVVRIFYLKEGSAAIRRHSFSYFSKSVYVSSSKTGLCDLPTNVTVPVQLLRLTLFPAS